MEALVLPAPQHIDVDSVIARLAALPKPEARRAFFAQLESLEPFSRERIDLAEYGRSRLAPGPFLEAEYAILVGYSWPRRGYTPEEQAVHRDHAEAIAILQTRRDEWDAQMRWHRACEARLGRIDPHANNARSMNEAARVELAEAKELETVAFERYETALAAEVSLRPHQPPRKLAAGRNWLRALAGRGGASQ